MHQHCLIIDVIIVVYNCDKSSPIIVMYNNPFFYIKLDYYNFLVVTEKQSDKQIPLVLLIVVLNAISFVSLFWLIVDSPSV